MSRPSHGCALAWPVYQLGDPAACDNAVENYPNETGCANETEEISEEPRIHARVAHTLIFMYGVPGKAWLIL
ncbi:MAG: hypothetical protein ABSH01_06780 [Terriglobia bacterium]